MSPGGVTRGRLGPWVACSGSPWRHWTGSREAGSRRGWPALGARGVIAGRRLRGGEHAEDGERGGTETGAARGRAPLPWPPRRGDRGRTTRRSARSPRRRWAGLRCRAGRCRSGFAGGRERIAQVLVDGVATAQIRTVLRAAGAADRRLVTGAEPPVSQPDRCPSPIAGLDRFRSIRARGWRRPRRSGSPAPDARGGGRFRRGALLGARGIDIGIGPRALGPRRPIGRSPGGGRRARARRRAAGPPGVLSRHGRQRRLARVGRSAWRRYFLRIGRIDVRAAARPARVRAAVRASRPVPTDAAGRAPPRASGRSGDRYAPEGAERSRSRSNVFISTKRGGSSTGRQTSDTSAQQADGVERRRKGQGDQRAAPPQRCRSSDACPCRSSSRGGASRHRASASLIGLVELTDVGEPWRRRRRRPSTYRSRANHRGDETRHRADQRSSLGHGDDEIHERGRRRRASTTRTVLMVDGAGVTARG